MMTKVESITRGRRGREGKGCKALQRESCTCIEGRMRKGGKGISGIQ